MGEKRTKKKAWAYQIVRVSEVMKTEAKVFYQDWYLHIAREELEKFRNPPDKYCSCGAPMPVNDPERPRDVVIRKVTLEIVE